MFLSSFQGHEKLIATNSIKKLNIIRKYSSPTESIKQREKSYFGIQTIRRSINSVAFRGFVIYCLHRKQSPLATINSINFNNAFC